MIPRLPADPARRAERKADLLLASQLLRGQAVLAVDDLGERADVWGRRWYWLQGWLTDPSVQTVLRGGAAVFASLGRSRRPRMWQLARTAWSAWWWWRRAG